MAKRSLICQVYSCLPLSAWVGVVPCRSARPQVTVVHFHGGGYCVGSARTARSWAAHLSAATGCMSCHLHAQKYDYVSSLLTRPFVADASALPTSHVDSLNKVKTMFDGQFQK